MSKLRWLIWTPENIHALLSEADLILDATDNFETRYLINDFAVKPPSPGFTPRRGRLRRDQ